jgi:hypothetical protein
LARSGTAAGTCSIDRRAVKSASRCEMAAIG